MNYRDEAVLFGARSNSFTNKNYNIPVFVNEEIFRKIFI